MDKQLTRVAVDAMGGDFAPHEVVIGAIEAAAGRPDVKVLLVGQMDRIDKEFASVRKDKELAKVLEKAQKAGRLEVVSASEVLEMDEEPARGIRNKKDCSINVCMQLVKEGRADAMMSAGNSGAVAAAAMFTLKRIEGVARPAIAMIVPTRVP
ncbi:MAG: phosphate acyltransferase, partial [Kiritimatiellia bacterium]